MKRGLWLDVLIGIWLIIDSFILPSAGMAVHAWSANDVILGILLIAFSWWMLATVAPQVGAAWLAILSGIWLIIAPFVLGYSHVGAAVSNDIICGVLAIIVTATASTAFTRRQTVA